jgi:hypothetical protein
MTQSAFPAWREANSVFRPIARARRNRSGQRQAARRAHRPRGSAAVGSVPRSRDAWAAFRAWYGMCGGRRGRPRAVIFRPEACTLPGSGAVFRGMPYGPCLSRTYPGPAFSIGRRATLIIEPLGPGSLHPPQGWPRLEFGHALSDCPGTASLPNRTSRSRALRPPRGRNRASVGAPGAQGDKFAGGICGDG